MSNLNMSGPPSHLILAQRAITVLDLHERVKRAKGLPKEFAGAVIGALEIAREREYAQLKGLVDAIQAAQEEAGN